METIKGGHNMEIIKDKLNNNEIFIIDTGIVTTEEKELKESLKDAILTINKGFFKANTIYPIKINNTVLATWINSKNYIHFYMGKYHMAFDSKNKLKEVNQLFSSEMRKLVDEIIEDNQILANAGYFTN